MQVEALSDLLQAETETQRRLFLRQNRIGKYLEPLRDQLIDLIVRLEASIDFVEDVDPMKAEFVSNQLENIYEALAKLLESAKRGCLIRTGVHVAIVGATNVGKSSVMNRLGFFFKFRLSFVCLAEKDIAIVSNISGTTRDSIDVRIQLNDVLINITDTAGIRATDDPLELEGIRRSIKKSNLNAEFYI